MVLTSACLLKHKQLITCRRATLGATISDKLAIGKNIACEEKKMKVVDGYLSVLCTYNPDADTNCLTEEQVCLIIRHSYKLLPTAC